MPQFDVHRSPGRRRPDTPFVVIVQSARCDGHARRLVVPLSVLGSRRRLDELEHSPVFVIEGQEVALDPLQMQAVPREALGPAVASLADDSDRIIRAIDAVLSGAYG